MKTTTPKPTRGARRGLRPTESRDNAKPTLELSPLMLKIKSILVPIDFSPKSKKALGYAVRLAQQFHARLTLQYVVEPVGLPDFAKSFPLAMENDQVKAITKGKLEGGIKKKGIS